MIAAIGWVANTIGLFGAVPLVYRLIKTRNRHGVSSGTYVAWLLTAIYWGIWGAAVHSAPIAITNAIAISLVGTAVVLTRPSRRLTFITIAGIALASVGFFGAGYLAILGSITQVIIGFPQLRVVLAPRADLSGVAVMTWVIITINSALAVIYDVLIHHSLAATAPTIMAFVGMFVVVRVFIFRHSTTSGSVVVLRVHSSEDGSTGCAPSTMSSRDVKPAPTRHRSMNASERSATTTSTDWTTSDPM